MMTQTLPYDMARCWITDQTRDCPLASRCLRRIAPGRDEYQAYAAFPGGGNCPAFIPSDDGE